LTGPHRTANNEYGAIKNADKITRNVCGNALETHKIGVLEGTWRPFLVLENIDSYETGLWKE
jgi:hypothetical protein